MEFDFTALQDPNTLKALATQLSAGGALPPSLTPPAPAQQAPPQAPPSNGVPTGAAGFPNPNVGAFVQPQIPNYRPENVQRASGESAALAAARATQTPGFAGAQQAPQPTSPYNFSSFINPLSRGF